MTRGGTWAVGFAVVLLAAGAAAQPKIPDEQVPFHDYNDILALFQRLGYTKEAWQAGIREVPPVYVAEVPSQWRDRTSKLIPVAGKKELFFRVLAPIVLKVNEVILADRTRAEEITKRLSLGESVSVSAEDQAFLAALAVRCKLIGSPGGQLHPDQYPELLLRVDIVPPSLSRPGGLRERLGNLAVRRRRQLSLWSVVLGQRAQAGRAADGEPRRPTNSRIRQHGGGCVSLRPEPQHAKCLSRPSPRASRTAAAQSADFRRRVGQNAHALLGARPGLRGRSHEAHEPESAGCRR